MTTADTQDAPVFACDLTAIAADELEGSIALAKRLLFIQSRRVMNFLMAMRGGLPLYSRSLPSAARCGFSSRLPAM